MFIDIHAHITYKNYRDFSKRILHRPGFDVDVLLKRMDMEGIEKSVVLPLMNAEVIDYYGCAGNQEVLDACREHPDRLIPFCGIEPRSMTVWHKKKEPYSIFNLLSIYKDLGCRGIGEACAAVRVDDERYAVVYEAAAELDMPLLFHFQPVGGHSYGAWDEFHLPGLERMLKRFPRTVFIGHSTCFWTELSGDLTEAEREGYMKKPYTKKGRIWELLAKYPNMRCDISAGSGAHALECDPEHGAEFLNTFADQLYFGTDRFSAPDEPVPPQIPLLNSWKAEGKISAEVYEKITHLNAEKLLKL